MNNWDTKPQITVVLGADSVPQYAIGEVLKDTMAGREHWESTTYSYTGWNKEHSFEVVNDSGIEGEHLGMVMSCLNDHMQNVKIGDWLSHQSDLLVNEKDWVWVDIAYGVYYGPNCMVHVWYVTI